jgi:hypothetical protein
MKIKIIIKKLILLTILAEILFVPLALNTQRVMACGSDEVEISVPVDQGGTKCIKSGSNEDDNAILNYLRPIIIFITAGVGMVLVLMIIIAGIRWIISQGNPQGIAAAQKLLFGAVVSLLVFIFAVAILNYLIPGKLFG